MQPPFDVIMCLKEADKLLLLLTITKLQEHIHPRYIIIIASESTINHYKDLSNDNTIIFIDENTLYEGLTLQNIEYILQSRISDTKRAGWYLQQFLKMAYAHYATHKATKLIGGG